MTSNSKLLANIRLAYNENHISDFMLLVDLSIPLKGITVVFGESGCGKTTLLRCIAGLESAATGTVMLDQQYWQKDNFFLPTHKRKIGYVFQEASLFEHLTAAQNLRYAQNRAANPVSNTSFAKDSTPQPKQRYEEIIDLMGIAPILARYPNQLSGGERQRVAIARALMSNPSLLLMDEPLASLDYRRKQEILPYLEKLRDVFAIPVIYVTHACDELVRLADYAVLMEKGRVVTQGPATEVFAQSNLPLSEAKEQGVVLSCQAVELQPELGLCLVKFAGGDLWLMDQGYAVGSNFRVSILAKDVSISIQQPSHTSVLNTLPAKITRIENNHHKSTKLVTMDLGNSHLIASITVKSIQLLKLSVGCQVWAMIKSAAIVR